MHPRKCTGSLGEYVNLKDIIKNNFFSLVFTSLDTDLDTHPDPHENLCGPETLV